jgi:hypothetical protein
MAARTATGTRTEMILLNEMWRIFDPSVDAVDVLNLVVAQVVRQR